MKVGRTTAGLLAAVVVLSMAAGPVMAAMWAHGPVHDVNHDADIAQDPHIQTNVTVSEHDREVMSSPLEFENDSGDLEMLEGGVNDSDDIDRLGSGYVNAYQFKATDVWFHDAYAFPHDNANTWANSNDWTESDLTATNSTTATEVDAVEFSTNGSMTANDVATATFSENVSIDSDVNKRYLAAAVDVESLDADAVVVLEAVESDGDTKNVTLVNGTSNAMASADDVAANSTGEGAVVQQQLASQSVYGGGDGSLDSVDKIVIKAMDADATIRVSMLNAEKIGEYQFAKKRVDTDDDDNFETETVTEPTGTISTHDLSTMGQTFDQARIMGLTYPAEFNASDLSQDPQTDVNMTAENASGYPDFPWIVTQRYRLQLPSAYDLSYTDSKLVDTVSAPNSRYQKVGKAEGASDTNFSELTYSDVTSTFSDGTRSEVVVIDNTITTGQEIALRYESLSTNGERRTIFDTQMGGAGVMAGDGGSGGFFAGLFSWIDAIVGGALGLLGLGARRRMGGS
jgi:hypothetical protein